MSPTAQRILEWIDAGNTGTASEIAAALHPMSIDSVYSALKRLVAAGFARIVAHGSYKGNRTDIYGAARVIGGPITAQAIRNRTALEVAWAA